jgi:hypothetical protein
VEPLRIPEELAEVVGRHVVLYGERGELCTAALAEPELVARTDALELDEDRAARSAAELAERAWQATSTRVVLGSRATPLDGRCQGASFATFADEPTARVLARQSDARMSPQLAEIALRHFRDLPAWAELQASYDLGPEPWEQHDGGAPSVSVWSAGGQTIIGVDAAVGSFCGDFKASLWALFEVRDTGLELLVSDTQGWPFPTQLFDLDGDGRLEMMVGERLLVPTSSGVEAFDVEVPSYGCPC